MELIIKTDEQTEAGLLQTAAEFGLSTAEELINLRVKQDADRGNAKIQFAKVAEVQAAAASKPEYADRIKTVVDAEIVKIEAEEKAEEKAEAEEAAQGEVKG